MHWYDSWIFVGRAKKTVKKHLKNGKNTYLKNLKYVLSTELKT